jgi:hypothetical protein
MDNYGGELLTIRPAMAAAIRLKIPAGQGLSAAERAGQ